MKPLTIDELRALKAGDWVWIIDIEKQSGYYRQVTINDNNEKIVFYGEFTNGYCPFETYGKTWLAYKNKEQAECKGEIVEFPCKVGDTVYWAWSLERKQAEVFEGKIRGLSISCNGTTWFSVVYNNGLTFEHTFKDDWGKTVFTSKAQAERVLRS